ncbi:Pr6Pr family membrane protein [Streptomyces apricus]|uniref:Integral membrane regulator n=1 Tax=Streptomyces apricus TaxID=1828112 RepID=A0A5B0B3A7_9ACTN|nr:Pr6Pr family membrane protein [Streptomyces apricus]KAA0935842.1 integral membrane regulator [Streptomyces apricus]
MTAPIPADIPDIPRIPGIAANAAAAAVPVVPAYAVVPRVRRPLVAAFRLLIALSAVAGVALALLLGSPTRVPGYFTILSTLMVAVVSTVTARRAWTARHPLRASVTACTLLYAVGGSLVYHLLLADNPTTFSMTGAAGQATGPLTGWHALTSLLLHTVIPVAVAVDWLLLTLPGALRLQSAITWMILPLAYLACTVARGLLLPPGTQDRYPYPFLDVSELGFVEVLGNIAILGVACYGLAVLIVAVDHVRPGSRRHRPPENRISSPATSGLK